MIDILAAHTGRCIPPDIESHNLEKMLVPPPIDYALLLCDECGGVVVFNGKEFHCSQCGLVVDYPLSYEYYTKKEKSDRLRHKPVDPVLADQGLGSAPIKAAPVNEHLQAIRRIQKTTLSDFEKRLAHYQYELRTIAHNFNLPEHVVRSAMRVLRKAVEHKVISYGVLPVVCACIYYACRSEKYPMKLTSFKKIYSIKKINKAYKKLVKALNARPPITDPEVFLQRAAAILRVPPEVLRYARELIKRASNHLAGRQSHCIAAGALYVAAKERNFAMKLSLLAKAIGVNESSILDNADVISRALQNSER